MAKGKGKEPVTTQPPLPGTMSKKDEKLYRAAEKYARVRDKRMEWNVKEKEAYKEMDDIMEEQNRDSFQHGRLQIFCERKIKVKIGDEQEPLV
jgi:hypothetical protein